MDVLLAAVVVIGVVMMAYPTFSDWWNDMHQSRAIAGYVEQVSDMTRQNSDALWSAARAYNEKLSKKSGDRFLLTDEEKAEYERTLNVTGTGIMGYVNIPKIGIELPVYHGTDPAVLEIAIGHIEGSSLPVGGKGTHCVISGHRGLPSAKLFTDLDQLQEGDTFQLQVLNRTLVYEVDQIRIVLPDELSDLAIDPDKDYCTLVTCTPYGVNTHRLLVRGHRMEASETELPVSADAVRIDPRYVVPVIALPVLLLALLWILLFTGMHRKKDTADEL
ncbi:MAG: class C sortase [Firmicutes bacterium]|nr:class C sortase [Bacillota bacterium]